MGSRTVRLALIADCLNLDRPDSPCRTFPVPSPAPYRCDGDGGGLGGEA
jgi:hypothetical protein